MDENGKIFDRALYRKRRARFASTWAQYDFLKREGCKRLGECLDDITRTFPLALDLGSHTGLLPQLLKGKGGVKQWITADITQEFSPQLVCDEEWLPFADNSFDLIASVFSLHHVNDLPGTLIQIKRALKPDGLFLAIMPGANSLKELRMAVTGASAEYGFALSPRIAPFVEIRDAGALLIRAGFALPVADSDTLEVSYPDAFALMLDLQGMGESNVLLSQHKGFTSQGQMTAISEHYQNNFGLEDGTISASFEFITLTGWKS